MTSERVTEQTMEWFKDESLDLIRHNITARDFDYPNYPTQRLTQADGIIFEDEVFLPSGPWYAKPTHSNITEELTPTESVDFARSGLRLDQHGRPIHPWIESLVQEDIGVFTGKGFYYHWGANRTVDPIVIRNDLDEQHVLLVVREDTKHLALPGGFHDKDETYAEGAAREAKEETLIDLGSIAARAIYSGPLADSRATANAWPHTDAFRFDLPNEIASQTPMKWDGGEEVECALWVPVNEVDQLIFGSHSLLIALATNNMESTRPASG